MERKTFASIILTFLFDSFIKKVNIVINNDPLFIYRKDNVTDNVIKFIKVTKFIDGREMTSHLCDDIIYVEYGGNYYHRQIQGPINIKWYGIKGLATDDPNKVYNAFLKAWNYCCQAKKNLYIPSGVYNTGIRNFPFRYTANNNKLFDCKYITIYGDGESTLLKTESELGADVLQLNRICNVTIKDLSITATVKSSKRSGSNGISITNGFDNIVIENILVFNLRGINNNGRLDGGKALTVQISKFAEYYCGNIIARKIVSKDCLYGFTFDSCLSDVMKKKINIDIDIEVENSHIGIMVSNSKPYENVNYNSIPRVNINSKTINCQKDIIISRGIGITLLSLVSMTKTRDSLLKAFDGEIWNKNDMRVWVGYFNYIKKGQIKITGEKLDCDYKIAIGAIGAITEPFNLLNRTEDASFQIDIGGKAKIKDFEIIDYKGNSIYNTKLTFSKRTLSGKPFPPNITKQNLKNVVKYLAE